MLSNCWTARQFGLARLFWSSFRLLPMKRFALLPKHDYLLTNRRSMVRASAHGTCLFLDVGRFVVVPQRVFFGKTPRAGGSVHPRGGVFVLFPLTKGKCHTAATQAS